MKRLCYFCYICIIILSFSFVFSCASNRNLSRPGFKKAPLFGMVYDYDSRPVAGVKITLDDEEGPLSDINGRFILPDIIYGPHSIKAVKAGYETVNIDFEFLNRTQVLYIKVASLAQLMEIGENRIKRKEWGEAEQTLLRASKIDKDDPALQYLQAVLAYRQGNNEKAESFLLALLSEGHNEAYLYLLLADVYEFGFRDLENAAQYLKNFLDLKHDEGVEERLNNLE